MSLNPGVRLGAYEVLASLGVGGMGEVYRARDTRLGREVAIKILPPEVSRDEERFARFEREARLLASLNHPNVATLHGFEEVEGTPFLVMELVEGETLAERIARSPLPLKEALALFHDIAFRRKDPRLPGRPPGHRMGYLGSECHGGKNFQLPSPS